MPRWYEGLNINHEGLMSVINDHRRNANCYNCPLESPTYLTLKLHNAWRKRSEKHLGAKLPNTILPPEAPAKPAAPEPKPEPPALFTNAEMGLPEPAPKQTKAQKSMKNKRNFKGD